MQRKIKGAVPFKPEDVTGQQPWYRTQPFDAFSTGVEEKRLSEEIANLRSQEKEKVTQLVSSCRNCDSDDIRIRITIHFDSPGNGIYGPAGCGSSYSTQVDFLYCENCGTVFYKSGVEEIQKILWQIREKDEELSSLRNPRRC